ncbi:sodium:calcium antiporter [Rhodopirellula halodulae]|uniref:sodium:calcium antiporter n=1 Tax=Rhodopirellula halodulae TaxID=2894198 RepID=UPI001E539028|nr:sodium:calcium antiporter [Rhodopirellula sp. JC737]MCC9657330.1 sodium:calcium antiporter [Rhodopirellula sp. JC737]
MGIVIPLVLIFITCLIIWRACDGFEIASEYIGRNLSEGVRGGTINAISSSIPELFTTLIALFVLSDHEGFSIGIGTTAGSALFNGMIIPAVCILSVVGFVVMGTRVTSVNVSLRVLLRDGLSLIFCEFILILLINGEQLHWWQGLTLILLYVTYLITMLKTMRPSANSPDNIADESEADAEEEDESTRGWIGNLFYWLSGGPALDLERWFVKDHHREQMKQETWNGWWLLLSSTGVIAAACWGLVLACEWLGSGAANAENPSYQLFGQTFEGLGMPAMFVAVIFASMATSVPDTVMSIRDARDGDYDDAVANALGSNIFDICFALGFPLFLYTMIHGPIQMAPEVAQQSGELRLFLFFLTIVGFLIYYIGKRGVSADGTRYVELKRGKAFALLTVYALFVLHILALENDIGFAQQISDRLQLLLQKLPAIG